MIQKFNFEPAILKAYDIRGVVEKTLSEEAAYFVGKSYGTWLIRNNKKSCVLGYDGRHTSIPYSIQVTKGLRECGINVTNIGLAASPMVYFALKFLKIDSGIIITASHNPGEYNGFKMLIDERPVWGKDIQELGRIAANGDFENGTGTLEEKDVREDYMRHLLSAFKPGKKDLKIIWDAGNGVVGGILDDFVAKLPGTHKTIFSKVDGDFPNHHPDPSVAKNLEVLMREVVEGGYDFGVAFDGDGDRVGVVDNEGYLLYGDQLLVIYARNFLEKNPGERVMSEVKASKTLYDDIKKHGGVPIMGAPGHSLVKVRMNKEGIRLAGETSGHMYFGENHNFDDALYASVKLMDIMVDTDKTVADIRKELPKTFVTREIRVNIGNERKFEIPKEINKRMIADSRDFCDIDGVRVNTKDGWWLVRTSNTEPVLTTRCESLTEEGLEIAKSDLRKQLLLSGSDINWD